jgi:hypothetical protein
MKPRRRCRSCYSFAPGEVTVRFATVLMQGTTRYFWQISPGISWVCGSCARRMAEGDSWRVILRRRGP